MPTPKRSTTATASVALQPAFGDFLYGPITQQMYYGETQQPVGPSTYERPGYPSTYSSNTPPANPVEYATEETGAAVLEWAQANWPGVQWSESMSGSMRCITADNGMGRSEQYNAGQLAFMYDKNGAEQERVSFNAELKLAHLVA